MRRPIHITKVNNVYQKIKMKILWFVLNMDLTQLSSSLRYESMLDFEIETPVQQTDI